MSRTSHLAAPDCLRPASFSSARAPQSMVKFGDSPSMFMHVLCTEVYTLSGILYGIWDIPYLSNVLLNHIFHQEIGLSKNRGSPKFDTLYPSGSNQILFGECQFRSFLNMIGPSTHTGTQNGIGSLG